MRLKRTENLINKWRVLLERDPSIKEKYEKFVDDYEKLMEEYEELIYE